MSQFQEFIRGYPYRVMVMPRLMTDTRFKSWKESHQKKDGLGHFLSVAGGRKQARHFLYLIFRTQEMKQEFISQFASFVIQKDPQQIREESPRSRDLRAPEIF